MNCDKEPWISSLLLHFLQLFCSPMWSRLHPSHLLSIWLVLFSTGFPFQCSVRTFFGVYVTTFLIVKLVASFPFGDFKTIYSLFLLSLEQLSKDAWSAFLFSFGIMYSGFNCLLLLFSSIISSIILNQPAGLPLLDSFLSNLSCCHEIILLPALLISWFIKIILSFLSAKATYNINLFFNTSAIIIF